MAEAKKPAKKSTDREKAENVESIVIALGKKGTTPAKIGLILRDKHNVPKMKPLGKKISQILKENKITFKSDLDLVNDKISKIENHFKDNKQDKRAKREIVKFIGLRKKLQKYNAKNL